MITIEKFQPNAVASIGFLLEIHPSLTNRKNLHRKMLDALGAVKINHEEVAAITRQKPNDNDTNMNYVEYTVSDFQLPVVLAGFGFGNGTTCIVTRAIDIQCAADNATLLKELFARCTVPAGQFIPRGLVQLLSQI
jgi:hypothetical protein